MNRATAIILAGGKSSRMGMDKGMVLFNGKRMVEYAIELLSNHFEKVIIVTGNNEYSKFGHEIIHDEIASVGPIGGIYSGLKHSSSYWNFVIACDMPMMNNKVIDLLKTDSDGINAIVPYYLNEAQPLCAYYNQSCIPIIETHIQLQKYKMKELLASCNVEEIIIDEHVFSNNPFENFNTMNEVLKNSSK